MSPLLTSSPDPAMDPRVWCHTNLTNLIEDLWSKYEWFLNMVVKKSIENTIFKDILDFEL